MICSTYKVCRQTVSTWFSKWDEIGICGLIDLPGRGCHSLLDKSQKNDVIERVRKSPRFLKSVLADLETDLGFTVSIDTIKIICKQAVLSGNGLESHCDQSEIKKTLMRQNRN